MREFMENLEEIRNFGPYMVKVLNLIGIHSKEDLLAADYKKIKANLVEAGVTPHLNLFYSIEMGLQNRRWNEITHPARCQVEERLAPAHRDKACVVDHLVVDGHVRGALHHLHVVVVGARQHRRAGMGIHASTPSFLNKIGRAHV